MMQKRSDEQRPDDLPDRVARGEYSHRAGKRK
jgi:hypothetical protein